MNTDSEQKPEWVVFSIRVSQTIAQCFGTFSPVIQYCWSHIEVMYPLRVLIFFLFCFKLSVKSALWIHYTGVPNFKLSIYYLYRKSVQKEAMKTSLGTTIISACC